MIRELVPIIIAVLLIAGSAYLAFYAIPVADRTDPCAGTSAASWAISDEERTALIEQGWHGDPNDQREWLYPPYCELP